MAENNFPVTHEMALQKLKNYKLIITGSVSYLNVNYIPSPNTKP